ncbi:MAG TPA: fibronectin type III domain-containing protein [Candidatus Thermoplasmatota archaeon]|nr:fibronectin type III domain-containing protein [Candidatus Thermoplasmatota archaeon]
MRQATAVALLVLLLAPALPPSLGSAPASGHEIVADAASDHADGSGLAADLLRVGASTDASTVKFFLKVADRNDRPLTLRYRLGFQVEGGLFYYATVSYSTGGTLSGATLWRAAPDVARVSGNPIPVAWAGNELRLDVPRSGIGNPPDGATLSSVTASVTSAPPGASELPGSYALYDATDAGAYVVGTNPVVIEPTAPTSPRDLSAAADYNKVLLSWTEPADDGASAIHSYHVHRATGSGGFARVASVAASQRSYTDNDVVAGTSYRYRVSAENGVGEGPASAEASATPLAPTPPSAPRNPQATPGNEKITLSWNAPAANGGSAVSSYRIYRAEANQPLAFLTSVPASPRSYVDAGVVVGTTYVYQVSAVNAVGEGPRSAEVSAAALPLSAPSAPRNLVALGGYQNVTLTWFAPASDGGSPVQSYHVYRVAAGGSLQRVATKDGDARSHVVAGLVNGQSYTFVVSAQNGVGEGPASDPASATPAVLGPSVPNVVVAQFDTGVNPFHPCFRRPGWDASRAGISGFPANAVALPLDFRATYAESLSANAALLATIQWGTLYHIPNTNLLFYGHPGELIDTYPHGAQAASQVVCEQYGMAPDAWLVVLNWYSGTANQPKMAWVAQQRWIDVVHLNIQDIPFPVADSLTSGIRGMITAGQLVVIAGGNGVAGLGPNYPMELSRYNGPVGSLIAGANDNGGYTIFSNLNPHVVMDGGDTLAASPNSYGTTTFGGTSSASPRTTGYAAALLQAARASVDWRDGRQGSVLLTVPGAPPAAGPLADGALTVAELHEVIRKTANPNPHDSKWNGGTGGWWVPQPANSPAAVYAKMGYGMISEHTFPNALAVLTGQAPMPQRPVEDAFYALSTLARQAYWG